MSLTAKLVAILLVIIFIASVLFVLFGQITVRKLRKNPKTKSELGLEFAGGWDILNTAQALSLPKSWNRRMQKRPLFFMSANANILYDNTTKFDRILGRLFYWTWATSALFGIPLVIFDYFSLIPE